MAVSRTTELLGITAAPAQLNINKLAKLGIWKEVTSKRRNRIYIAPEIIQAIEEDYPKAD